MLIQQENCRFLTVSTNKSKNKIVMVEKKNQSYHIENTHWDNSFLWALKIV